MIHWNRRPRASSLGASSISESEAASRQQLPECWSDCHSDIEALQLRADDLLQAGGFVEVSEEFFGEAVDLVGDGFLVAVVDFGGTDVSARASATWACSRISSMVAE